MPEYIIYPLIVGLVLALVGNILWREHFLFAARQKFRSAIHSVAAELPERPAGYFTLDDVAGVKATIMPIDLACRNFSLFLNKRKGIALDQAMQAYRKACQEDIPQRQRDWTEYIIQCAMHNTKEITPTQMFKTHIDALLSFADKT